MALAEHQTESSSLLRSKITVAKKNDAKPSIDVLGNFHPKLNFQLIFALTCNSVVLPIVFIISTYRSA